jgi:hypothetical protein
MSEIASPLPEGTSTQGSAPKSWSARLCLAACLVLFAVVATMMSGFDAVVVRAVAACLADWRIPAGIILGVALAGGAGFVMYWLPSLVEAAFLALLAASVPCFWFMILTATTNDGVHLVSAPLASGMIVASLLFATCASLHFRPRWGSSKKVRLYTGFLAGSFVTLAFTGVVSAVALDSFRVKARDAAEMAFAELNKDKEYGAGGYIEMSGYTFDCLMSGKQVSCRRTHD